ncbi:MAG: 2Fe-2S iron-sulfur cluster binding domain-containing protein [Planctomycetes bacterium]|nr:2Fe-2S iron-sulfur cluster binding domain-containing protein [Planctomycetota bacterium]
MDLAIRTAALAFLVASTLYVCLLAVGAARRGRAASRMARLDRDRLRIEIERVMDQRHFERQRNELSWNGFRKFRVIRKEKETADVCSFYLAPHDGKPLPPFHPGQYLTFRLGVAGQARPVVRCYSLSDAPCPDHYRVSIKRLPPPRDAPEAAPGLASSHFHDRVDVDDILDVQAPAGSFYLDLQGRTPVVLVAGGIGVTPLLSMLEALRASGSRRETWFFYGVRNGTEHVQREALERAARERDDVHLHVCYSEPRALDVKGRDYHHPERVSVGLFRRLLPSSNYEFYVCGPPPMMTSLTEALAGWGVSPERVHFEAFGPATVQKMGKGGRTRRHLRTRPQGPEPAPQAIHPKVTFARSARTCEWKGEAASLLDLAEAEGIAMDSGCRAGNCGTCLTAVLSGEVSYVQEPGTTPEAGSCLACVCVPRGDLSLDA